MAVLEPAAAASGASVALRRAHAAALNQLGFVQMRQHRYEAALASLHAALVAYRSIDDLQADSDAMANFGIATAWLMEAYLKTGRPADATRAGEEGLRVTSQLLERQPTNMLALRARGLISGSVAEVAENELQQARRLAAANDAARDWALLSRIDPSNMISKGNLINTRTNAAGALWDLARPRDSLAKHLENRELEPVAAVSQLVAGTLSVQPLLGRNRRRRTRAGRGGRQIPWPIRWRHFEIFVRDLTPATFEHAFYRHAAEHRPGGVGQAAGRPGACPRRSQRPARAAVAVAARQCLRQAARGRAIAPSACGAGLGRVAGQGLRRRPGQFALVAEARKSLPTLTLTNRREAADDAALLAITLAHGGRLDEARALAEPALALQRELHARQTDDQWHKFGLALALLATAQATPAQAGALLAEAQAALDSLPGEARNVRTSQMVQALIADARQARR